MGPRSNFHFHANYLQFPKLLKFIKMVNRDIGFIKMGSVIIGAGMGIIQIRAGMVIPSPIAIAYFLKGEQE